MTASRLWPLALAALAFAATGCDEGRTNPPDTSVRVVNAAPGFALVVYRRESIGKENPLAFKTGAQETYDEDTYDFNFGVIDANNLQNFGFGFSKEVLSGTIYTFAVVQDGTTPQAVVLEAPAPAPSATDSQVAALNAAQGLPAMDVFLERPGADIAGAVPWGTIAFLAQLPPRNVATGDYEITITEAGNRANVLFASTAFTLGAAGSTAFVIAPEAGEGTADLSIVVALDGNVANLPDRNAPAAVRVINAPVDQAPRDVAFRAEFNPPAFPAVAFAEPTAYIEQTPGTDIQVNATPPGNPGVLELDQKVTLSATRKHTLLISGAAGALVHSLSTDDGRRIEGQGRMTFYNAAPQFATLDLLVLPTTLPAGVDATNARATATLAPGNIGLAFAVPPDDYDLWLRKSDTLAIAAGPVRVTVAARGVYGVLATNGADTATSAITLLDDFP